MERNVKLEKVLKKIIGYKLIEINEEELVIISKDNEVYVLRIENEDGFYSSNLISISLDKKIEPIITDVKAETTTEKENEEGQRTIINFYNKKKPFAKILAYSTGEDGYKEGNNVSLHCKRLDIAEIISEW